MELIAAVLVAGPLGYFGGRRGLVLYLGLWAIIFPIQTLVVHAENADDIVVSYFVINALILVVGIGLNRLGARLRRRRDDRREAAPAGGYQGAEPSSEL
jgi:hypothetical protein